MNDTAQKKMFDFSLFFSFSLKNYFPLFLFEHFSSVIWLFTIALTKTI